MDSNHFGLSIRISHVSAPSFIFLLGCMASDNMLILCLPIRNMAPTICAPAIELIISEFHITSNTISTLATTIYILGLAIGPMFTSALSELYGRQPVLLTANLMFVCFVVGCALSQSIAQLMAFRFLSGCAGGTPMTLGG